MYQSIISLGAWCQVSEQLRLHKLPRTLSPLEWTVATWDAMTAVIRDDGQRLCHDIVLEGEVPNAVCKTYGLVHPHDFHPPCDDFHQWKEIDPKEQDEARSKYARKMEAFRQACRANEGRIAFIRMGGEAKPAVAWPYMHDKKPVTASRVNTLVEDLKTYCGHENFDLFVVLHEEWHPFEKDVELASNATILERPPVAPPVDWFGHQELWTELLQTMGILELEQQNAA